LNENEPTQSGTKGIKTKITRLRWQWWGVSAKCDGRTVTSW